MKGFKERFQSEHGNEKVPLYRSYGVWRKSHPVLSKILFYTIRCQVIFVLAVLGFAVLATVWSILAYADTLIATALVLSVFSVLGFIYTRTLRKRLKHTRKIKKLCRSENYKIQQCRKFIFSFKWNTKAPDFILETDNYVYYVHYLTVNKYNSTLTFKSPDFIDKVVYPLNNKFTLIFELKPKRSRLTTAFEPLPVNGTKKSVRAILVNPVCREMFEASKNGGLEVTGNGMEKFGYTVFTSSGFAEAVKRNELLKKK